MITQSVVYFLMKPLVRLSDLFGSTESSENRSEVLILVSSHHKEQIPRKGLGGQPRMKILGTITVLKTVVLCTV